MSGSRPGVKGPDSGQTPLGHSPVAHGQSAPASPPHRLPHGKGRAELPTHSSFTADLWPSTEVPKVWEHQTTVTLLVASE